MLRATKVRLYPTTEQKQYLVQSFGCCRWYWNYSLNLANKTYQETGRGLNRGKIQALLPGLKKELEWLKTPYSQCLQVVALNLSRAFLNFFDWYETTHSRVDACPLVVSIASVEETYKDIPLTRTLTKGKQKGEIVSNVEQGYVDWFSVQRADLKQTKTLFLKLNPHSVTCL